MLIGFSVVCLVLVAVGNGYKVIHHTAFLPQYILVVMFVINALIINYKFNYRYPYTANRQYSTR